MLVLGTIVHQEEEAGRGQALHQAVKEGLRLGVDPVQILKDEEEGLLLALAQEHPLQGIERALAALRGIELQEWTVVRQGVQEGQERWEGVLQGRVQRQDLSGHLGPDGPGCHHGRRYDSSA